jgi:hypothetical protein
MKRLLTLVAALAIFSFTKAQISPICMTDFLAVGSSDKTASQGVFSSSKKWLPGQTIKVKFLDGSQYVRGKVQQYSKEWETYGNIKFQYVTSGTADIRISFSKKGSWSQIGKDALHVPQTEPTMNYGWFNESTPDEEFRRTTLHEFGHALGLLHEHQHADRPFEWNIPVVMNDFVNGMGWTKEMVYSNYIYKYGKESDYSNKVYDRYSIMHYEIPPNHTMNGFRVGNNTTLSAGDKQIIAEMYPKPTVTEDVKRFQFRNVEVSYDEYRDGVKGLVLKIDFSAQQMKGVQHRMSAYFYKASGEPLKDENQRYNTTNGNVATGKDFTPEYDRAEFNDFELFLPYSELHLGCGDYNLKFSIAIWNGTTMMLGSGDEFFNYWKCASIDEIEVDSEQNVELDGEVGLAIYPMFAVRHAQNSRLRVTAYFYFEDGEQLEDFNDNYTTDSGHVSTGEDIVPCCPTTGFSLGDTYDFALFIPYDELHLGDGTHELKFFVSVWDGNTEVITSDWTHFELSSE